MKQDVEARIAELARMSDARLKIEHAKVFGWEPLFEGREQTLQKLSAHLRDQAARPDPNPNAENKEQAMDASATTAISKLRRMDLKELQAEYERVFEKPSKSRNREWLFKVIAKKLQDNEEPESANKPVALPTLIAKYVKKPRSKNKTKSAAREKKGGAKKGKSRVKPVGGRDPRLPKVGTTIERVYKGKKLLVTVEQEGFTFGGKHYRSLSALAKHITGQIVNGFLWFGLTAVEKKVS